MESNALPYLFFTLFLSCIVVVHSHGKKQLEALNKLQTSKLKKIDSGIDTSHFQPIPFVEGVQILPQAGFKEKDRIERLPGQPQVQFTQYGGYVTVNESAGRALYYYFAEAQESNESHPLLLWLNGGPGCSSLGFGAMQELGPFRVLSDGKTLYKNDFAWNHVANLLFLESPAGVGFSYSNTTWDYMHSGDTNTASDNYVFLLNWLERFPEYKNREFYISGESYAGHYVPQLANTILYHNKIANKTIINLKGITIGNAVTNDETDEKGVYDYFVSHALISDETSDQINKYCDFSPHATKSSECNRALDEADLDTNGIDVYGIYSPLCIEEKLTVEPMQVTDVMDPCTDYYVHAYLNRPDVQEALHANVTNLSHGWEPCSVVIRGWKDSPLTVIPILKELIANDIRVWIFSGDTDGRVPVTATKYSINLMNLPVKTSWHPWIVQNQVGGYTQVYEGNLTFATVKGAGHQVPSYEPDRALSLITNFLSGTPLPAPITHT